MNNSKKNGIYEFLVYPDRDSGSKKNYVGVCLTLDIVEEGPDPHALMQSIIEAAKSHVSAVIENNLDDSLLNRPAPRQYWV